MRKGWAGLVVVLLLAGCGTETLTEPEPDPTLSGHWVGSTPVATSSGGSYTLTLDLTLLETVGTVAGSGFLSAEGLVSLALSVKQGTNNYPSFSLVMGASGFQDITYSGTFNSATEILGKLNGSGFVDQWLALRKG